MPKHVVDYVNIFRVCNKKKIATSCLSVLLTYLPYFTARHAYETLVIFLFQISGTLYNKPAITRPFVRNFIIYFDVVWGEERALKPIPITQGD